MVKSRKKFKREEILIKKFRRNLFLIPFIAFALKILIILNIQGFAWHSAGGGDLAVGLKFLLDNNYIPPNAWYGADGENYIQSLYGLVSSGFFSTEAKLSYWPAGYPLLMWPILELFRGQFFAVLAIIQSALYMFGAAWFADELSRTRVGKSSYLVAIFLAFNPTLALNTISVGYELPVVSLSLVATAAFIRYAMGNQDAICRWELALAAVALTLSTLMQPRLIILSLIFFVVWALAIMRAKVIPLFLAFAIGTVSIGPAVMIYRNLQVHDYVAVSTNLGITMRLGAGPGTSGGYSSAPTGLVQCPETEGNAANRDAALVRCVLQWYGDNPGTALKLFWNKARYFWSPWFGPEANGTMARNPWSQNHPFKSTIQTVSGFNLIYGGVGKTISWLWMLAGLALLIRGVKILWKIGGLERALALMTASAFLMNLVSSMLTIGDHRFRIPSMGMTLFLQAIGFSSLFKNNRSKSSNSISSVTWPSIKKRVGGKEPSDA